MVLIFVIVSLVSGCTVSQSRFIKDSYKLSDVDACRAYIRDKDKLVSSFEPKDETEKDYLWHLKTQVKRRKLSTYRCEKIISESNNEKLLIGTAILGAIAVGMAASQGSGSSYQPQGYAWDAFYDQNYNLVWRCRNRSNGQFAYDSNCMGKVKVDTTWPQK